MRILKGQDKRFDFESFKESCRPPNSKLLKNADGLLATKSIDQDIQWVEDTGKRIPENQFALSY